MLGSENAELGNLYLPSTSLNINSSFFFLPLPLVNYRMLFPQCGKIPCPELVFIYSKFGGRGEMEGEG